MKKTILLTAFGLISIASSQAAATASFADATAVPASSYVNPGVTVSTPPDIGGFAYTALFAFDIDTILTSEGMTIGDLATYTFTVSFETVAGTVLPGTSYAIGYGGNFAGATVLPDSGNNATPNAANWLAGIPSSFVDTGIADIDAAQTISLPGLSLAGASAGETVIFGAQYLGSTAGNYAPAANMTLTAVPEPSSTALLGLGGLALIMRRRK